MKILYIYHAKIKKQELVKINHILVIAAIVTIKETLYFYKSEPLSSDDDNSIVNKDVDTNDSRILMSVIFRLQKCCECYGNSFQMLARLF